ncbi:MAG TPA: uroporphyrinogen-III synthase [Azospirillaceae bacterium]|nr:uroporphyrinogen-III synthase [Azospirillaceae bacterium]
MRAAAARSILLTRPRVDADALGARLRQAATTAGIGTGFDIIAAPMLEIVPRPGPALDLDGVQAVLATSRNGVRALAARTARRDLPLYAVGDGTAAEAHAAGFTAVESASGDVAALAALAARRLRPQDGVLVHAAGAERAGALAGTLAGIGFHTRVEVLYEARPAASLPDAAASALLGQSIGIVAFFSPRTARTFATVAVRSGLVDGCRSAVAVCLSDAVANTVRTLPWRDVRIAARPDQDSLVALILATMDRP